MSTCLERALVDRHFRGAITPADERRMRAHLPGCTECRAHYQRWLVLERLDPQALGQRARLARGLGLSSRVRAAPAILTVATLAAALLLGVRALHHGDADGFTARGAASSPASSMVAPELLVYAAADRGGPSTLLPRDVLARDQSLAFAYTNPANESFVAIFAVDDGGQVYWYYPAWTDPADDPVSIPIVSGAASHDLPDAVRHDLHGRSVMVHALFSRAPLHVREVEARVARGAALATSDEQLVSRSFRVAP